MPSVPIATVLLLFVPSAHGQQAGQHIDLVMATVRLSNPKSTATGFVVVHPPAEGEREGRCILVTAAHVLEKAEGDEINATFHRQAADGNFAKVLSPLKIRKEGKPRWSKHAEHDIAAVRIELPEGIDPPRLTIEQLATPEDFKHVEPGDLVRCVVNPHASVFEPSAAGFPLVRLGCVASYPLLPLEKHPNFLVDYNTFEGDSGGPVFWTNCKNGDNEKTVKILGLILGQHLINQRYQLTYASGEYRKRLGLAIVVHAQAIRETIALLNEG